jgi:hypothetical protein
MVRHNNHYNLSGWHRRRAGESLEHSINSSYAPDRDQVTEALLAKELQQ